MKNFLLTFIVFFIVVCLFSPLLSYSQLDNNGNLSISQLNLPEAVTIDSNGMIYVADTGNSAVEIYDPSGNLIKSFGSLGSGKVQFENPDGIAVDNSGNIYVADESNDRIEELDSHGTFIQNIVVAPPADQSNLIPIQISSATATVYGSNVTSNVSLNDGNANAQVRTEYNWGDGMHGTSYSHSYNSPGTYQIKITITDNYGNSADIVQGISIGSAQNSENFQAIQLTSTPPTINGNTVTINANYNDPSQNAVLTYDYSWGDNSPDTQQPSHTYAKPGIYRIGVSVSDNYGNGDGVFQTVVIGSNSNADRPYHPKALAVDQYGDLYVGDSFNSQVYEIFPSNDIAVIGNSTVTHDPEGIALDSVGNIYVTDQTLNQINIFDPVGNSITTIQMPQLQGPQGIAVDNNGNIYVADTGSNSILVVDRSGNIISTIGGRGGALNSPEDVAVDSSGNIYVADTHNYRVIKISSTTSGSTTQQSQGTNNQETSGPLLSNTQSASTIKIPSWIKNNAGWWASGQLADSEFIKGIQYLIQNGIIQIPSSTQSGSVASQQIPSWIKNNAGWWASGQISDGEFVKGLQYLVSSGIIQVS